MKKRAESRQRVVHPALELQQASSERLNTSRPVRVPLNQQKKLDMPVRAGYVRRFVLDKPGRIEAFLQAGWTFVMKDGNPTHDGTQSIASQMSSAISRVMNMSKDADAHLGYGMEIPKELYDEDQRAKEAAVKQAAKQRRIADGQGMYGQEFAEEFKEHK